VSTIPPTIGRARLQQTPVGLRIVIPPQRTWYLFIEAPMLVVLAASFARQLEEPLVAWTILAVLLVAGLGRRWLWNLVGHEIVTVNKVR
jgi:hypothetical protein